MQDTPPPIGVLPLSGYIRQSELLHDVLPFSSPTLWRKVKAGTFPRPIKLSQRVTAWRISDVQEWLKAREAEGRATTRRDSPRKDATVPLAPE